MCGRLELMDGDGRRAWMSGWEVGETHGEVSLAQGELFGLLGKARELLDLGFFLCKMGGVD